MIPRSYIPSVVTGHWVPLLSAWLLTALAPIMVGVVLKAVSGVAR